MSQQHHLLTDFGKQCAGDLVDLAALPPTPPLIRASDLLALLVDAAREAAGVIVEVYRASDLRVSEKTSPTDLVTTADIASQAAIVGAVRLGFGRDLQVVCEEGDVPPRWSRAEPPLRSFRGEHAQWAAGRAWPELPASELCLWIDPLDSTYSFTSGNLARVTVLIGVTLRGLPIAGVIGAPFTETLVFGCEGAGVFVPPQLRCATSELRTVCSPHLGPSDSAHDLVVATSSRSDDAACADAISRLEPVMAARLPGAGAKFLLLFSGEADAYVWPRRGLGPWDVVAGAGIARAAGGLATDKDGRALVFFREGQPYAPEHCRFGDACCDGGLVVALRPETHARIMAALRDAPCE